MQGKEKLMKEARGRGICKDGYDEMRTCNDMSSLIEYYVRTIDWSLENGYPMLEDIREMFDKDELMEHGIFHDDTFSNVLLSGKQAYIFHNCGGKVRIEMDYDNAVIPMLYFANGCDMEVVCEQRNNPAIRIPLYVFGENKVVAKDSENALFVFHEREVLR